MSDLNNQNKVWFARHLERLPHGEKGRIAKQLDLTPTQISRMANVDPKTSPKNTQNIPLPVLRALAERFNDVPPGLIGVFELPPPRPPRVKELVRIPLLDKVAAGKLKSPSSQIPVEDVPLLAYAGLGRGEFFALSVEGDSMDRISPEGSTIVVNQAERTLIAGKPYVFSVRGAATFKLWRPDPPRLAPFSTNPMHEPIFVKSKADAEKLVIGRVKRTVLDL